MYAKYEESATKSDVSFISSIELKFKAASKKVVTDKLSQVKVKTYDGFHVPTFSITPSSNVVKGEVESELDMRSETFYSQEEARGHLVSKAQSFGFNLLTQFAIHSIKIIGGKFPRFVYYAEAKALLVIQPSLFDSKIDARKSTFKLNRRLAKLKHFKRDYVAPIKATEVKDNESDNLDRLAIISSAVVVFITILAIL